MIHYLPVLMEIRRRSGVTSISFAGEKSTGDFERYENLGLTTGTAFIPPDNYDKVRCWSEKLKYKIILTFKANRL